MRRVELPAFGIDGMHINEVPVPEPGEGQLRVKVTACSINYRDNMIVNGFYKPDLNFPLVPLSDCAGVVDATGPGVTEFKPGDKVVSVLWQDWEEGALVAGKRTASPGCESPGVLSEHAILQASGTALAPETLTAAEAACISAAGLTAFASITTVGQLKPGGSVLTLGTGGVSIFALQFAKAMGATVVITSSSDEKLERAKELGADHVINYRDNPDWGEQAFALTGGVDVVVETAGAGTLAQSMAAVGFSGRIAYLGALAGMSAETNLMPLVVKNASIHGVTVSHRQDHIAMTRFIDEHAIKPVIDRHYAFEDGIQAIKDIVNGEHFGKLVVDVA